MDNGKYIDKSGYVRYHKGKRLAYNKELFSRYKAEWTVNEIRELVNARPQMKYEDIGLCLNGLLTAVGTSMPNLRSADLLKFIEMFK